MAKIQLNGKKITVKPNLSLISLLRKFNLVNKKIAIEFNGKIVPRTSYKKKYLKDKNKIEIVHFIGGG